VGSIARARRPKPVQCTRRRAARGGRPVQARRRDRRWARQTGVTPYDAEGINPTTNATDHVYAGETNGANLLSLSGDNAGGYAAALIIVLPITSTGTGTMGMGGNPGGGPGGP
jgi:hypothetical protein